LLSGALGNSRIPFQLPDALQKLDGDKRPALLRRTPKVSASAPAARFVDPHATSVAVGEFEIDHGLEEQPEDVLPPRILDDAPWLNDENLWDNRWDWDHLQNWQDAATPTAEDSHQRLSLQRLGPFQNEPLWRACRVYLATTTWTSLTPPSASSSTSSRTIWTTSELTTWQGQHPWR
jgi:hypothetical protein